MLVRVFLWENGEEQFVSSPQSGLTEYLLQTLCKANLQVKCYLPDEQLEEIKKSGVSLELSYRFSENITIGQWVKPEDRDSIKTDENGYRILEQVRRVFFILEDPLGIGLKAHFVVDELQGRSCWALQKEGEVDESWIEEAKRYLLTPVQRYLTYSNGTESKLYLVESHLSYGVFDEDVIIPLKGRSVKKGDPAVIIKGTVRNDYDSYYYFAITGDLYNSKGEKLEGANYIFNLPVGEFVEMHVSANSFGTFELRFGYGGEDIEHYDLYLYMERQETPPP
jgi:hypothetical protein